jgi:hypothetical protein
VSAAIRSSSFVKFGSDLRERDEYWNPDGNQVSFNFRILIRMISRLSTRLQLAFRHHHAKLQPDTPRIAGTTKGPSHIRPTEPRPSRWGFDQPKGCWEAALGLRGRICAIPSGLEPLRSRGLAVWGGFGQIHQGAHTVSNTWTIG